MDNIVIHIRKDLHSKIKLSPWSLKSGRPKPAARHPAGGDPGEFTQTTSPRHPKMSKKQNSNINVFRETGKFGRHPNQFKILLADYLYALRSKTGSLARYKIGRI